MPKSPASSPSRYGIAIASVLLAVAARWTLPPLLGERQPFVTFYIALIVSAWFGGLGPSLLALALGALSALALFTPRPGSPSANTTADLLGAALYVVVGSVLVAYSQAHRTARSRLEQAEASERRQRRRVETTLASIGDAVLTTDAGGRVAVMNPVAEALTGWTQHEAVGKPLGEVFRIVNEETRNEAKNPADRARREGAAVGRADHTVLIARNGKDRAIDGGAAPIRDDDGAVTGSVLVFRDVAGRRDAEQELARSERELADFFENATVGLHWVGPDGTILRANRAELEMLGYDREEYIGRHIAEFHADEAVICDILRRLQAGEALHDCPARLRCKDGSVKDVLIDSSVMREGGEFVHTRCFTRDVTGRLRAEAALRDSEGRFRTMAESIPQLAWMARPDGHIYWYNRRWHEYTGTTPEQMEGWGWQGVHDPEVLPSVLERWKASIAGGEPFDMVFPLRGADGEFRPFLTRVMPVRDENGKVAHWFGTNTDIADRLEVERELREAKEEAEAASRAKTQFLAVLSHELRTPLNPILLATTAMLDRPARPEEIRPTLEMIRRNVNLQAKLIDDLLDVMRVVRGRMRMDREVADCHRLVEEAVEVCRSEVRDKSLHLEVGLAAVRRHCNADPARLKQVFWNLIKNAVKYTPEGGTVAIRTHNGGDDDGTLVVEVSDSGVGIEPEVLPRIFDPFQQGETTVIRRFGGLGLGLAICKGIVEAHGGELSAGSPGPGRGATFRVELEALADPETRAEGPAAGCGDSAPTDAGPLRILVVEDEAATLRLMARLLRALGHEVREAGTLAGALEVARSERFDLIVSDIGLPDGSGLDLMRRVTAERGALPSIALSGFGTEEDIRRSREVGFSAHMTKPIDFSRLEAVIRQVVVTGVGEG